MCVSEEEDGRAGEAADTELKTKTPHVNVGKNTKKHHTKTRKSQANKKGGKPTKPKRTEGSEAGRTKQGRKGARGEEGKRRPAEKEREDAREGSRGRREKTAQAKKAGARSVSGVLRGFWITQGRIPQCRCERHLNNTHNMVERAKPHTGRSLCCHEEE